MEAKEKESLLLINTKYGEIKIKLYNETPLHRKHYLNLVEEGFFTDRIFHRVISEFMIQGGESASADSLALDPNDISSEINFPQFYHHKGALAAARMGNDINPDRNSSGYQFYIVVGDTLSSEKLISFEKQRFERMKQEILNRLQTENKESIKAYYREGNKSALADLRENMRLQAEAEAELRKDEILYTDKQKEVYTTIGGTPHLDGEYTVFGEVVDGLDIVDKIQQQPTGGGDRPIDPIVFNISLIDE